VSAETKEKTMSKEIKELTDDLDKAYDRAKAQGDTALCSLLTQAEAMIEGLAQEVAAERSNLAALKQKASLFQTASLQRKNELIDAKKEIRRLEELVEAEIEAHSMSLR
jgi:predicted component of viral defense system (DUF524 family)